MAGIEKLKELLYQRLAAMADEILELFQATVVEYVEQRISLQSTPGGKALFPPHTPESQQQHTDIPQSAPRIKAEKQQVCCSSQEESAQKPDATVSDVNSLSAQDSHANLPCTTNDVKAALPWIKEEMVEVQCSQRPELFPIQDPGLLLSNADTSSQDVVPETPTECSQKPVTPREGVEHILNQEPLREYSLKLEPPTEYSLEPEPPSESGLEPEPHSESGLEPEPHSESGLEPEPPSESGLEPEPHSESGLEPEPLSDYTWTFEGLQDSSHEEDNTGGQEENDGSVVGAVQQTEQQENPQTSKASSIEENLNHEEEGNTSPASGFDSEATLNSSDINMDDSEDDVKYMFFNRPPQKRQQHEAGVKKARGAKTKRSGNSGRHQHNDTMSDSSERDNDKAPRQQKKRRKTLDNSGKPQQTQKVRMQCSYCKKKFTDKDEWETHRRSHFPR